MKTKKHIVICSRFLIPVFLLILFFGIFNPTKDGAMTYNIISLIVYPLIFFVLMYPTIWLAFQSYDKEEKLNIWEKISKGLFWILFILFFSFYLFVFFII